MKQMIMLLGLFIVFGYSCTNEQKTQEPVKEYEDLGVLNYDFTISEASKDHFDKGLLLLHSFEYDDARTAFKNAKKEDSTEIMNYWGEAMSHYKALWGLQDKRAGMKVMEELGMTKEERLAQISDPLERDFWGGIEILYGDGTLTERNGAFADYMGELSEHYPDNQEVRAFYALSLLWRTDDDEEDFRPRWDKAADIATSILEQNPNHPGALHYKIHAFDSPETAMKAINEADLYADVAPDAAHALHMPSHIYLAMGMWNEVVSSNEDSYQASVNRMERLGKGDEARGYHSFAWLHYGYLQQGRFEKAEELLREMHQYIKNTQTGSIRSYLLYMQAAQLFETGKWPDNLEYLTVKMDDLGLSSQMNHHLSKAKIHYLNGNIKGIEEHLDTLRRQIRAGELLVEQGQEALCNAGPSRYAPNPELLYKASVVEQEILAFHALAKAENPEPFMKKAVEIEAEAHYSFGPPDIMLPSFEMYAEYLMDLERYDEALEQIEISLERAPNRRKSLMMNQAILIKLGRIEEANKIGDMLDGFSPDFAMN